MKNLILLFVFGAFIFSQNVEAQISTPAASPAAKVKQTVGLTEITVEYSRPGVKGRTIFADDGLVPFGKIWRTGANAATKVSFSDDVTVGGVALEAGSYALLTKPTATEWAFHFYPYESRSFGSYVEKEPAAVVTSTPSLLPDPIMVESFSIGVSNIGNTSANIHFMWEKTWIAVPVTVDVDSKVMADIEKTLGGPTPGDYYTAGSYYHDSGKDLGKALKYVQKATHSDNPRFWQVRKEALILADMGKHKEAIAAATKSMELAKEAGNDDYVSNNKKSIAEWTAKMKM